MVTVPGIIIVAKKSENSLSFPLKGTLANIKAAIDADITDTKVVAIDK